ncbi:MAG: MFS transporter [Actinobacteria bacterium]|nr:MFS transporter [Actinomycetota bacterium]
MLNHESHQRKVVRVLSIAQVLNGVGVAGTVAAGSLLVSSITKSEGLSGLAQTTSVLGAAVMALPLARLTQRGGRRLALTFGYSTGVIGAGLAIFGGTKSILFFMLLGAFMVGAASASGYQARFAAIDLAIPENRSKDLSFVVWGSTIGAVTGPNLMEPSGKFAEFLGLPKLVGPYFIAAFTLFFAVVVIQLFLKPDPYLTANQAADGIGQMKHQTTRAALAHVREYPKALFAIAAVAVGHLAMVSIMVMTPVHMAHYDVTLRIIGFVISVHVLGMYAFSPVVGSISDKLGRIRTIQIGILILIASALIAGLAPHHDSFTLGIGLFLLGLGWSFTLIAGSTLLSETVSIDMRPATQGASDLVMNLMGAGGAAVGGVIIGFFSFAALCYATGLVVLALGVWSIRINKL